MRRTVFGWKPTANRSGLRAFAGIGLPPGLLLEVPDDVENEVDSPYGLIALNRDVAQRPE